MDYHSLKRRELQALCKEHNIPANSANSVLVDKLAALFNEKQKPITRHRTCMKSSIETTEEGEPAALKRQAKKVRFSPSNDLVEYELRSGEKQKHKVTPIRTRRKSMAKKVDKPAVDNNTTVELVEDSAQVPVKLTRSRVILSGKDNVIPNNEKKQSRRGAKVVEKGTDVDKETEDNVGKVTRSKAHTLKIGDGAQREESRKSKRPIKDVEKGIESVEETVVSRARVTRSKAHTLMEGGTGPDVNPHVKKKSGKQVATDGHVVEPSKEVMDIPVRATRSRRQTLKEDIENSQNMVTNPQADKKRTRRQMKDTDLRSNSSHVAPADKQEPPKRKSLRTRGVETVDEDEGDKVDVVDGGRLTRSKASVSMEASGRNSKNKANQVEFEQLEEPTKHAGKKNINRRKSVLRPDKTEVVLQLEEPVNRPARKITRRKSVVLEATKMVESSSVGKKQSKGESGNLSMIVEGIEDKENVIGSGKGASVNEYKKLTSGSPKSRKRRGTPIIEDQIIDAEYDPVVDKSPKPSTRSASKSEGKSVAKKQMESRLNKPVSRMNNQSSVENASKVKSSAIRSGAIIRDSSSKKKAKVIVMKQSDLEDHDIVSSKEGTPSAKMGNFKVDEVTESEVTPAIDKSDRRFTRSTIISERKEPSQSAINEQRFTRSTIKSERKDPNQSGIKEQRFTRSTIKSERKELSQPAIKELPTADAQLFSPKVPKFRPDPAVNTAPGRITRRGIKHGENAAVSFSEKIGKKKQASQLAHKKPPLDDALMASPEVAKVGPTPVVGTIGVQSEVKQPLDEVQMSSPEVAEVGLNTGVETIEVQPDIKRPLDDVQVCSPETAEVWPNPDSDAIGDETEICEEVTDQILGDLSASESVSLTSKVVEKNIVSECRTSLDIKSIGLGPEEKASGEVMGAEGARIENLTYEESATPCLTENLFSGKQENPLELQTVEDKTPLRENLSHIKMASVSFSNGCHVQNQNEEVHVESGIFSDAVSLETSVVKSGRLDAQEKEMDLIESGSASKGPQTDVMIEEPPVSVGNVVVLEESVDISSPRVATKGYNGDADNNGDPVSYDAGSSAVCHSPIEQSDVKSKHVLSAGVLGSVQIYAVNEYDVANDGNKCDQDECTSAQKPMMSKPNSEDRGVADGVDVQENSISGNDISGDCGNAFSDQKSGLDMFGTPLMGKGDVAGDSANVPKEPETGSEPLNVNKTCETPVSADDIDIECAIENNSDAQDGEFGHDQLKSNDNPAINEDVGVDDSAPARNECMPLGAEGLVSSRDQESEEILNVAVDDVPCDMVGQPDSVTSKNTPKTPATSGLDDMVARANVSKELVLDINEDVEFGHDQSKSNDNSAINEEDVGVDDSDAAWNERMPVGAEGLVSSRDQEPEQILNVAVDDVPCDTVGQPDSVTSKNTPKTPAISGLDDMVAGADVPEEFVLDINKDVVSSILGDIYDMDADEDNEQKLTEVDGLQPKESGDLFPDTCSEQTKEEAEMSRGDDHTIYNQEQAAASDDLDSDIGKFMEDGSHIGVDNTDSELVGNIKAQENPTREEASPILYTKESSVDGIVSSQLMGDISAHESLITKKAPVDDTDSDLPTIKEDDRNKQEETRNANASVDWGDYDFGMDEFEEPVSANRSAAVVVKGKKDDQDSDLQTSNRTTTSIEESYGLAAGLANSVRNMGKDSRNAADGKSKQDVDMLNGSASAVDMTEEVFNWSDSTMRSLFATPTATRFSNVKDGHENAHYANQDTYSSLKSLTTPVTSRMSHGNDSKTDTVGAVNFTYPYSRCSEDMGSSRAAAHEYNHQWENDHPKAFGESETQVNAVRGSENEMYGVSSFEDDPLKLFGDEEVRGSFDRSGRNTHFVFKGDQVDQIKQYEFLSEAADGSSHHDPSGLKENSIHSHKFEKKDKM